MKNNQPKSKGGSRPGAGRPAGVPNKVSQEFRETVRRILEDNSQNFGRWLTLVAEGDGTDGPTGRPNPAKALDIITGLAEFAAPKLARTEVVGDEDKPVGVVFKWKE